MQLHKLGSIEELVLQALTIQNQKEIDILKSLFEGIKEALQDAETTGVVFYLQDASLEGVNVSYNKHVILNLLNLAGYKEGASRGKPSDWPVVEITLRGPNEVERYPGVIKEIRTH